MNAFAALAEEHLELVEVVLGEAGRADDRVHVVRRAPPQVLARTGDDGEVDAHLGPGVDQRVGRRRDVESVPATRRPACCGSTAATSSQSVAPEHGLAHRRSHAPTGAEHPDSDHSRDYRPTLRTERPRQEDTLHEVLGVERADDGQHTRLLREHPLDHPVRVLHRDRLDLRDERVDQMEPRWWSARCAPDAMHPARARLQRRPRSTP